MVVTVPHRDAVHTPVLRLGRNWIAISLAVAAVLYSAWVLQFPLHLDIDPVHAYVSELAAVTRADHRLFACTDLAAGLLALGTAAVVLLTCSPRSIMTRIGWLGFAGFGLGTVADSLLPLSCAPHADPGCATREAAHQLPIADTLHLVSSTAAIAALLVAIGSFTLATNLGTRAHRAGVAITVTAAATTLWTIAEVMVDDTTPAHEHVGLAQRLQLLALAAGVCYIAARAHTADDDRARTMRRTLSPARTTLTRSPTVYAGSAAISGAASDRDSDEPTVIEFQLYKFGRLTAAMVTYSYNQTDQARTELNAVSK